MDEVGRGALAGPLVACGVVIKDKKENWLDDCPVEIRDSKKMTRRQRELLVEWVNTKPIVHRIEVITVKDINRWDIGWANRQVFVNIIKSLAADIYILDGNLNISSQNDEQLRQRMVSFSDTKSPDPKVLSIPKADTQILEVMLASVLAKVYRDNLMRKLHLKYPSYGWDRNVGYGTKSHIEALAKQGSCKWHRIKFAHSAVSKYLSKQLQVV